MIENCVWDIVGQPRLSVTYTILLTFHSPGLSHMPQSKIDRGWEM
jgi:hypothetical protein